MNSTRSPFRNRSLRILGVTLLCYLVLVATHLGEFWPFSIYPMFSQAGNPWSRAIVVDVTDSGSEIRWEAVDAENLPGTPIALTRYGVDPIDLANFVSKTETWDEQRIDGLRTLFRASELGRQRLLVMRARGEINESDSVLVYFEPYVVLSGSSALLNPALSH